jgi:hypothetical protein
MRTVTPVHYRNHDPVYSKLNIATKGSGLTGYDQARSLA